MRIALDAMGGDLAPQCNVQGAIDAINELDDIEIVLVGDESRIREELKKCGGPSDRISIVHTTQVIEMGDPPVDALRQKKDSSILRLAEMGASRQADIVLSAGNTGAFAAACQLRMRTIPGIQRAGIAVTIPSFYGAFVLCDVGANIQPKAVHLHQYATMGTLFAKHVSRLPRQRVGLLSIGEENVKGTSVIKEANELLHADPNIEFIGNIEGRDLFEGACDVAVSDGFVGNVILKLFEGLSRGIFEMIAKEILQAAPSLKKTFDEVVREVWRKHDYVEYGGAPLLGLNGVAIICHGSSDARTIRNAIRASRHFINYKLNTLLAEQFAGTGTVHT